LARCVGWTPLRIAIGREQQTASAKWLSTKAPLDYQLKALCSEVRVLVNLLTATGLIAIMLAMGLKVTFEEVLTSLRRLRAAAAGVVANFVLVPAATIALLYLFNPDPMVSVGFLVLAVCPGAPVGPPFTAAARGDASYATGQMVILAGLSALLSPLLLSLFVARLLPESSLRIDYLAIVRTLLLSQLVPLAIGLGIHHWAPKLTSRIVRPIGLAANVLLFSAVVAIVVSEHEFLLTIRLRGWAAMCLLLLSSLGIGWLCGGPHRATRKALAVTTSARNAAVALVIVANNFADTAAVTAVVAYALISVFGTLCCAFLLAKVPEVRPAGSP
jgi:bile acid:Na+ symporter, BASS family